MRFWLGRSESMVGPRGGLSLLLILTFIFRGSFMPPLLDLRGFRVGCRRCPGVGGARSVGEREGRQRKGMQHQYPSGLVKCALVKVGGGGFRGHVDSTVTEL